MEFVRSITIKTSFSFAVCLIDSYTSAPVLGKDHLVSIVGMNVKPIPKPGGYYVFTDLTKECYQLEIKSKFYMQENIEVTPDFLESKEPILYVALMPNAQYPFGEEATALVVLLKDKKGKPAVNVKAKATITSTECIKAKLAQEAKAEGADSIYLAQIVGKLTIGDRFLIQSGLGTAEYCRIVKVDEGTRCYSLQLPLESTYEKGSLLFPVIESQSDTKGELLLFFKPYRTLTFGITLEFIYGNETLIQDLIIKQGAITSLGIIRLAN